MTQERGALTFVFSDIVGSTRLWSEHPADMESALSVHDEITSKVVERNGGRVFKHTGDGAAAVFIAAGAAIDASAQLVEALEEETWPTPDPIRVRVGVHSGGAHERGGDFFGTSVSRAARIMDAAHPGQILVSAAAAELARSELPERVGLIDLGEHRFKDLGERERVFQVVVDGDAAEFPPIRSLEAFPNNLPAQLTSFVGRDSELAMLIEMLGESRLITLTGVGGVGKTRLAIQAAASAIEHFPDGVWLVELAPLSDAALITREVAAALGIPEEAGRPLIDVLIEEIHHRSMLLVLDNCEHVINEAAKLSETLLRAVDGLSIIATSREGLAVSGERLWRIPSMTRGDETADAVALFAERAALVDPSFEVTDDNRDAVTQIVDRLDGIPLAIELATARLKVFGPDQIAEHLGDRFRLLTGGSRTALPRQRTLQATMDWSYELLAEYEKTLLRRLAVFYGGFEFEAAEQVCADDQIASFEVLDLLTRLVESSLVIVESVGRATRYRLLETVRQYALDRLAESGTADEARRAHAAWFADLADQIEEAMLSPQYDEWRSRLERDHDNIRAALTWSIEAGETELALRLAAGTGRFWFFGGFIGEGADWADRVLGMQDREPSFELSNLEGWIGAFALHAGDFVKAEEFAERAMATAVAIGNRDTEARSKVLLGNVELANGDLRRAVELYRETIEWAESEGSSYLPVPVVNTGVAAAWMGDVDLAREAIDRLHTLARDNSEMLGWALVVEGFLAERTSSVDEVGSAFEKALDYVREAGQRVLEAWTMCGLAEVHRRRGDLEEAHRLLEAGRHLGREIGAASTEWLGGLTAARIAADRDDMATVMSELLALLEFARHNGDRRSAALIGDVAAAALVATDGDLQNAADLVATADALLADVSMARPPYLEEEVSGVRRVLGKAGVVGGDSVTIDRAVEIVRTLHPG